MGDWWRGFFDADYMRLWGGTEPPERAREQVDALWQLCGLAEGARVLDAPCGYGRLSRLLADRGAVVLGVDQSPDLLAEAERGRGAAGAERLIYRRHDLRQPLAESGFDAALNIFSSLGYGTDDDDAAILGTLRDAVRPGGRVFVDTMHRDALAAELRPGELRGKRLADGTLLVEEPVFDPIAGRVESAWHWSGPSGSGTKRASFRLYCITELVRMIARAGLRLVSAHPGCSTAPFDVTAPRMAAGSGSWPFATDRFAW
jgi:SAM-dependent methyltransferase